VTPRERIAAAVGAALETAGLPPSDPMVMPSTQADYQANFAMALAKRAGRPPRALAQAVVDAIRDPSSSTTPPRTWRRSCTSATCARR
jgi:arginyl-tRNA synthetase